MAISGWYINFEFFFRWLHVFAGVIWVGHLYFFNFVNLQVQPKLDAATKKVVNPLVLPRALWWFRWGAMITLLSGLILFTFIYMYTQGNAQVAARWGPNASYVADGTLTGRGIWITAGVTFASVMWFNVWFVIWPAQQKILRGLAGGVAVDPSVGKRAVFASKMNTYLSAPMLFGMLGAHHYSAMNLATAVICVAVAEGVIYLAYRGSAATGATV